MLMSCATVWDELDQRITSISESLDIKVEQSAIVIDHVVRPTSVCPHIGIVAKRLIGSGCRLGW